MTCYHPLDAWKTAGGEIVFREAARYGDAQKLQLPCGQCIGCRLERSRQWATRCMHEASLYRENSFITLTYNEENVPKRGNLNYADFQLFMKRLRKKTGCKTRFYMGGEYGTQNGRPHFHACIFGYDFPDKIYFMRSPTGGKLYRSETLEQLWPHGYSSIAALTFQSAAYIARYCVQKVTGHAAEEHYKRHDEEGEYQLTPEFNRMSLKPGIGALWLEKYKSDVYTYDHVIINGQECSPPKYYDKLLKKWDSDKLDEFKETREERALKRKNDNTPSRLAEREQFQNARIRSLARGKV